MDPEEKTYPVIEMATEEFAMATAAQLEEMALSTQKIDIWGEGGFGETFHKQLGFTVWYRTDEDRVRAIESGESEVIENKIRDYCISHGFPSADRDRIYVWIDAHQALARGLRKEEVFNEWLSKETGD
jgi:hypothetical protein